MAQRGRTTRQREGKERRTKENERRTARQRGERSFLRALLTFEGIEKIKGGRSRRGSFLFGTRRRSWREPAQRERGKRVRRGEERNKKENRSLQSFQRGKGS